MRAWVQKFHNSEPDKTAAAEIWKDLDYDDSGWEEVELPHRMISPGIGWYRYTVDLPSEISEQNLLLSLAVIDDCDEVFVNGKKVGGTGVDVSLYFGQQRLYNVMGKCVAKPGRNVIAVHAFNYYTAGGMCSGGDKLFLTPASDPAKRTTLKGKWKFRQEFEYDFGVAGGGGRTSTSPQ